MRGLNRVFLVAAALGFMLAAAGAGHVRRARSNEENTASAVPAGHTLVRSDQWSARQSDASSPGHVAAASTTELTRKQPSKRALNQHRSLAAKASSPRVDVSLIRASEDVNDVLRLDVFLFSVYKILRLPLGILSADPNNTAISRCIEGMELSASAPPSPQPTSMPSPMPTLPPNVQRPPVNVSFVRTGGEVGVGSILRVEILVKDIFPIFRIPIGFTLQQAEAPEAGGDKLNT